MATLARSLVNLRNEANARWPGRDRSSDGWIGDAAHQAQGSASDHNPDSRGIVRAIDIDSSGITPAEVVAAAIRHPSTEYVIFNRQIWSRSRGFGARAYSGDNPHTGHIHVSIQHTTAAENSTTPWLGASLGLDGSTGGGGAAAPDTGGEGSDGGGLVDNLKGAVDLIEDLRQAVTATRAWLADRHNWVRVAWGVGGVALIVVGLVKLVPAGTVSRVVNTAKKVEKVTS